MLLPPRGVWLKVAVFIFAKGRAESNNDRLRNERNKTEEEKKSGVLKSQKRFKRFNRFRRFARFARFRAI